MKRWRNVLATVCALHCAVARSGYAYASATAGGTGTNPATVSPPPQSQSQSQNVVVQLGNYVKDSAVRLVDGSKEMWSNHQRCNAIRSKQKDYRNTLQARYEMTDHGLTPKELNQRIRKANGGITYDEFMFLRKGKEDRGKIMNLVFIAWGAPRFFPYALMMYPSMLPSPFVSAGADLRETKLEKVTRQRAHAVLKALIGLENAAREVPPLAKLNIFGKKRQQERMQHLERVGTRIGDMLSAGKLSLRSATAEMEGLIYSSTPWNRSSKRLCQIPSVVVKGLVEAIDGPNPLGSVLPGAVRRGQLLAHIKRVEEADNFIVQQKVDIDTISLNRLLDACDERLITSLGRSEQELRHDLKEWLRHAVIEPQSRIGKSKEHYNGNMSRSVLLSVFAMDGLADSRSSSFLPRKVFVHGIDRRQSDDDDDNHTAR